MSLLSNLLAFSSLNTSFEKQQRSASANSRFFFEDEPVKVPEPKQRVVSKSLSKMGLLSNSNTSKIDPKYRCLHRIVHNLNMKVRKHYYGFFVTLETMKKNNIDLSRKKCTFDKQKLQAGIAKTQQTFSITYLKQYENAYKSQAFAKIKSHSQKACLVKAFDQIYTKNKYRLCGFKLFRHLNQLQRLQMKIDLFEGYIQPFVKNIDKYSLIETFQILRNCKSFKTSNRNSEQKQQKKIQEKQVSIFQIYDNLQKKITPSRIQNKIDRNNFSQLHLESKISNNSQTIDTSLQNSKIMDHRSQKTPYQRTPQSQEVRNNLNQKFYSSDLHPNRNQHNEHSYDKSQRQSMNSHNKRSQIHETPYNSRLSLQNSPMSNYETKTKSPFKTCQKIPNLRQSVQIDTLQYKSYPKIYKCYKLSTNYQQQPFQFESKYESLPKMMNKLTPQQFCSHEVQDLTDKSGIFRDFKGSKVSSCFDNLSISNVVGEPFARADTLISELQKNRQRFDNISERSDISYAPYLPDSSLSSINKQESNFGCDAVNFKNSLVLQRQSMKKTQRQKVQMFVKKKAYLNNSPQQQNQELQNLKNNRRKIKNQYQNNNRVSQNIITHNYDRGYAVDNNYMLKRQFPHQNQYIRNTTINNNRSSNLNTSVTNVQSSPYTHTYNWEQKKTSHQYNSQGKNKSFSFNSSNDVVPRRIKFNQGIQYDKRNVEDTYIPPHYNMNSSFRDPTNWKRQFVENRGEMPVRDVGMQPISKLRMKNSSNIIQSQSQIIKEPKKYINLNRR